jgi:hypothetical protein
MTFTDVIVASSGQNVDQSYNQAISILSKAKQTIVNPLPLPELSLRQLTNTQSVGY